MFTWFKETSVGSTNTVLREKIRAGEASEAVVWAQEQTAGRGRLGRTWLSPQGGLFLSLSTRVSETPSANFFSVVVGVVAAELLRETYTERVFLKWPNDLVVAEDDDGPERKLGGILAEYLPDAPGGPHVIVGLGLNVNTPVSLVEGDASLTPASLCEYVGQPVALEALAEQVVARIQDGWASLLHSPNSTAPWVLRWKILTRTLGRCVRIQMPGQTLTGIARDLAPNLALLLEDEHGHTHEVHTGDCIHLRVG